MSEHKENNKWLYKFTIDKEIEVEKSEEREIDGKKVKVTEKVKENKPITFALKRPNRKIWETADLFYGVKLSEGIRAGLLTKALLLKRYRNDGGALSDSDAEYFNELTQKLSSLENEHQRYLTNIDKLPNEERTKKIDNVINQKLEVLQSLQTLENVNQALFAHTAETKAQIQLNNWWIVHLSYWDKNNDGNFVEFFPGETFEQKMCEWDNYDNDQEKFVIDALARFALLIGLWKAGAQTEEDFKQGERDYGAITDQISTEVKEQIKENQEIQKQE